MCLLQSLTLGNHRSWRQYRLVQAETFLWKAVDYVLPALLSWVDKLNISTANILREFISTMKVCPCDLFSKACLVNTIDLGSESYCMNGRGQKHADHQKRVWKITHGILYINPQYYPPTLMLYLELCILVLRHFPIYTILAVLT